MYHYFYLTNRNPRLSAQQFVDRWRRHAVMAAAVPEFFEPVRRYVQNDVLHDGLPGVARVTTGFDALGEFFFDSVEARKTAPSHITADGHEIFGPSGLLRFGGTQHVLDGQAEGPYRVMRILVRADGVSESAMTDALGEYGKGLEGLGTAISTSTQPEFDFDAALTVWVDDEGAATKLLTSEPWTAVGERVAAVSDPSASVTVVAREVVLKTSL